MKDYQQFIPDLVIDAGSVAKDFGEVGQHDLKHTGVNGRGGVVVKIDDRALFRHRRAPVT